MNFSGRVKKELSERTGKAKHCRIAEMAAMISVCGEIISDNGSTVLRLSTESGYAAFAMREILRKTFGIEAICSEKKTGRMTTTTLTIEDGDDIMKVLGTVKMLDDDGCISDKLITRSSSVTMKECCKRAFIRGAFLAGGSVTDPSKSYHMEIKCGTIEKAEQLKKIMNKFDLDSKIVARRSDFVVYNKEGAKIVDALSVMEAPVSLMEMENVRILKDMSNYYNREVNCETANIRKTVSTAYRQAEDIRFIVEKEGMDYLPEKLRETARLRLEHTDATLSELGEMMNPPVGKSGVNHRFRKISSIADNLRGNT